MHAMGETLPDATNRVTLNNDLLDAWGMPTASIDCAWKPNDDLMSADALERGTEMLEAMGVIDIDAYDSQQSPGLDIHEMGGARMGNDPSTSIVNKWNQIHSCKNVFVTDGACMTSASCVNPSLTYMALSARAANHAAQQIQKDA